MTEAEYKALHIALWQWLYDNPEAKHPAVPALIGEVRRLRKAL